MGKNDEFSFMIAINQKLHFQNFIFSTQRNEFLKCWVKVNLVTKINDKYIFSLKLFYIVVAFLMQIWVNRVNIMVIRIEILLTKNFYIASVTMIFTKKKNLMREHSMGQHSI